MRKLLLLALLIVLSLCLVQPQPAHADPGITQFCRDTNNLFGTFTNLGGCVGTLENAYNKGNADVVGLCKYFNTFGLFPNLGECVSLLRRYGF